MLYHAVELPQELDIAYIIPFADFHIGSPLFNVKRCKKQIDWVANTPNAWAVLLGDIMNTATRTSKSDIYTEQLNPHEQLRYAIKLLAPIKDKVLAVVEGNHERRIARDSGINTTELLAEGLGVTYSPASTLLKITMGRNRKNGKRYCYTLYLTHGTGAGRTAGGKINALRRLREIVLADVYVMGHVHWTASFTENYFVPDVRNNKIDEKTLTFVSTGSFLNWGGYAEEKNLYPNRLGAPCICLYGDTREVEVRL